MDYLIGLDIGTSSVKGILLSADGKQRVTEKSSFSYTQLANCGVELDAEDYIAACFLVIKNLAMAVPQGDVLSGICAASASGNLLLLDDDERPITPIYNWRDGRVGDEARTILGQLDTDEYYEKTGWPFDYHSFPLAMLCYLKCHSPKLFEECGKVCMSTEYLYYRLTGRWGISRSAGTPFYLIDQQTGKYNEDILKLLGINEAQLPPVGEVGEILGTVTAQAAEDCPILKGTPVVLGSFDHPSAARGAGVLNEGELLLSCGTSWVGFYPIQERQRAIKNHMLVDPFLAPKGCWGGMISLSAISGRIGWYIRRYIDDSERMFEIFAQEAAKSESGSGGLQIKLLDEPDDAEILKHPKCEIARAIMEGTVRLLDERLKQLKDNGISAQSAVMVGGPTENPLWIQIIREITGLSVRAANGAYAGAVGAAMLAGLATELYQNELEAFNKLSEN